MTYKSTIRAKQDNVKHLMLFIILLISCCSIPFSGWAQALTPVTVFEPIAGQYASMRIPALVVTKKGTLLAFCEGRINSASDWADMDILMRRSTDGGLTWEPIQIVARRQDSKPTSNSTPIVDSKGTIHLLYQRDYAAAYHIMSYDDGKTWTPPVDITYVFNQFRPEYDWKVLAPGPGHSIQLKNGRLVVPVWLANPEKTVPNRAHRPSCIATIYSDDMGKTWQRGAIVADNSPEFKNPSETVAVQLADGRVMLNIRNETDVHRRGISYSPDGATNWTKPVFDDNLYEPVCMASMISLPQKGKNGKPKLLFVNPDSKGMVTKVPRQNLTVKISDDEGKTWPVKKVWDSGNAGYSDVATDKHGMLYCLYETNNASDKNYRLVLIRTTLKNIEK